MRRIGVVDLFVVDLVVVDTAVVSCIAGAVELAVIVDVVDVVSTAAADVSAP